MDVDEETVTVSESQPMEAIQDADAEDTVGISTDAPQRKQRERKEPSQLQREPGKSLFPVARVQRILKADKVRNPPHAMCARTDSLACIGTSNGSERCGAANLACHGGIR
jgi:hypothetical protein